MDIVLWQLVGGLVGGSVGLIIGHFLYIRPWRKEIRQEIEKLKEEKRNMFK